MSDRPLPCGLAARGWRLSRTFAQLLPCLALLGCAAPTPPFDDEAAGALFRSLHEPVYQVYELGSDRDAIHGLLATSFDGEALTRQYVEHFTTLVRMGREHTSIKVVRVDYEQVDVLESRENGLTVEADWSVGGIVSHQEHRHLRTNRYRAVYDLAPTGGGWRIVATQLRNLERVETGLGLTSSDLPTSAGGLMSPLELLRAGLADDLPPEDGDLPPETGDDLVAPAPSSSGDAEPE